MESFSCGRYEKKKSEDAIDGADVFLGLSSKVSYQKDGE